MIILDDRTENEKDYYYAVAATDKGLSGWGPCKSMFTHCAWACKDLSDAKKVWNWLYNKTYNEIEKRFIYIVDLRTYEPLTSLHIYVIDKNHPGLQ